MKILHGGLRYLQQLDYSRLVESTVERSWWLRRFPDLVEVLPCLMPLYGDGPYRRSVFRLALKANDFLSRQRNDGLPADRRIDNGRVLSVQETVDRFPPAAGRDLQGAALWYDAFAPRIERLVIELLHWANACGALTLNHVRARGLLTRGGEVRGLEVADEREGGGFEIRARTVVNCAGPFCREVAARFDRDEPRLFRPAMAFNLLLDRHFESRAAVAVRARERGARTYFLVPWNGLLLAGTYHAPSTGAHTGPDAELVAGMCRELNASLPGLNVDPESVLRVYWGLLPAARAGGAQTARRPIIHLHSAHGGPSALVTVSGVKFTTARGVALKTLRAIGAEQGRDLPSIVGPERPPPAPSLPLADFLELAESRPAEAAAHVEGLLDNESARGLSDLVLRRTDWGADPRRVETVGRRIASLLSWNEEKALAEIDELKPSAAD